MGLSIFQGTQAAEQRADGVVTPESEFFREFSSTLDALFQKTALEGVLIYHPEAADNKFFQTDALLITANQALIIDFHPGQDQLLTLPEEELFAIGDWAGADRTQADDPTMSLENRRSGVRARSANPFSQLEKQRVRLNEILDSAEVDLKVSMLALFLAETITEGKIPQQHAPTFAIANRDNFLVKIRDFMMPTPTRSSVDIVKLKELFTLVEYDDLIPVELMENIALAEASVTYQSAFSAHRAVGTAEAPEQEKDTLARAQEILSEKRLHWRQSWTAALAAEEAELQRAKDAQLEQERQRSAAEDTAEKKRLRIWLSMIALVILGLLVYGIYSVLEMQKADANGANSGDMVSITEHHSASPESSRSM
ncbi:MAG: hypothetical protein WBA28_07585 [Microbacteriaceae bacterium]